MGIIWSAVGGATSGLIIVAFLGKNLVNHRLIKDLEDYKKSLARELAIYARGDAYKSELAKRQLDASEEMWALFQPTSLCGHGDNIIFKTSNNYHFDISRAEAFVSEFNKTFSGSNAAGLFMSEETRASLHIFRDFVISDFIKAYQKTNHRGLNKAQVKKFKELRQKARLSLRTEIGGVNITIANDEYQKI